MSACAEFSLFSQAQAPADVASPTEVVTSPSLVAAIGVPATVRPIRYLDTETTGFMPPQAHLVEIVILDADGQVLLATLVRPRGSIPANATRIHGITNAMVRSAPTWAEIEPTVCALLDGCEMIAHNAAFDLRFLGRAAALPAQVTCTMKMMRARFGKAEKLEPAAARAGHQFTSAAHRAEADTLALRTLHRWLLTHPVPTGLKSKRSSISLPPTQVPAPVIVAVPSHPEGIASSVASMVQGLDGQLATGLPTAVRMSSTPTLDPRLLRLNTGLCATPNLMGTPWRPEADALLLQRWHAGDELHQLTHHIARSPRALVLRLERLGAVQAGTHPFG